MTSLTTLDARVHRCEICGTWAWDANQCTHCAEHGYPHIGADWRDAA